MSDMDPTAHELDEPCPICGPKGHARHEDDSYGNCVLCREYVPHTDDEMVPVKWPCAVERLRLQGDPGLREALEWHLRRNVLIFPDDFRLGQPATTTFEGEWVAIPREDFDALRALAASRPALGDGLDVARLTRVIHEVLPEGDDQHTDNGEPYCEYLAVAIADRYKADTKGE